jgi:capsular polysaccharide biosynthesis protein
MEEAVQTIISIIIAIVLATIVIAILEYLDKRKNRNRWK